MAISNAERREVAASLRENIDRNRIRYDTALVHEIADVLGWGCLKNGVTDTTPTSSTARRAKYAWSSGLTG